MSSAREQTALLADLLRREHSAMADFLVALAELDRNRVWEALGHASLFSFLRRELGLSAGAAQYRKTAAELVRRYPEVEAALRGGRLCLSSVVELAKVITPETCSEVLPRFFGLSTGTPPPWWSRSGRSRTLRVARSSRRSGSRRRPPRFGRPKQTSRKGRARVPARNPPRCASSRHRSSPSPPTSAASTSRCRAGSSTSSPPPATRSRTRTPARARTRSSRRGSISSSSATRGGAGS